MDDLRERVEAVERALTDGDGELSALADGAAAAERVSALEDEVAALQDEVAELSTATQALRGYVGNVRSVNESVEDRADAAIASVESLADRVEALESTRTQSSSPTDRTVTLDASRDGPQPLGSTGPTGESTGQNHCRACGRPTEQSPAADGDWTSPGEGSAPSGAGTTHPGSDGRLDSTGATRTGESLDGFDPSEAGPRVTVQQGPTPSSAGREGTNPSPAGEDGEPSLVDRMREIL